MVWKKRGSRYLRSPVFRAAISSGSGWRVRQVRGFELKICTTSAPNAAARSGTGAKPPAVEIWAPTIGSCFSPEGASGEGAACWDVGPDRRMPLRPRVRGEPGVLPVFLFIAVCSLPFRTGRGFRAGRGSRSCCGSPARLDSDAHLEFRAGREPLCHRSKPAYRIDTGRDKVMPARWGAPARPRGAAGEY